MSAHSRENPVRRKILKRLGKDYCIGSDGSAWTRKNKKGIWRKMKLHSIKGGYQTLQFHVNKIPMTYTIHRLVLEAFVGPCPEGMEGCHNDGNPRNNNLENLRWDTSKENCRERGNQGVAKLTENDVKEIRRLYPTGKLTMQQLANRFGVSLSTIHSVLHRKYWEHIEGGVLKSETPNGDLRVKLTKKDIEIIHYLYEYKDCPRLLLAEVFRVTRERIHQIVRQRTGLPKS